MRTLARLAVPSALLALGAALLTVVPASAFVDKDCSDFASQRAAQIFFLKHGGPQADPHRLDEEGDGIACEANPAPYYYRKTLPGGGQSKPRPAVKRDRARIVKVIDGDTVRVTMNGHRKVVRMLGLDTPEVYGGLECGGRQASRSAKKLMPRGAKVMLISDPSQDNKDRYGRLLRYVEKHGKDISQGQIRRGWAKTYVYAHNPFKRVAKYRHAQQQAKRADAGIWSLCGGRGHQPL